MAPLRMSLLFYILAIALYNEGSAVNILSTDTFINGDTVTVTCDLNALELAAETPPIETVTVVTLARRPYNSASTDFSTICTVSGLALLLDSNAEYLETNIPFGRDWNLEYPNKGDLTGDNKLKADKMKITLTMTDATCTDAGLYKCSITPFSGVGASTTPRSGEQQLNVTVRATSLTRVIVPDYTVPGEPEPSYKVNDTITMTCHAEGPEDYVFNWKSHCVRRDNWDLGMQPWLVQNDIATETPQQIGDGSCGGYRHSESLKFTVTDEMQRCTVFCEFGGELDANFTYIIEDIATPIPGNGKAGQNKASSGSSDDLVIGLTVSLLLVAIIVVAVLVYVCWWRKRTPSQDKYKDEPDVGHNKDQEVPPVFYSKPHKAPKVDAAGDHNEREKWNSKDGSTPYDDDDDELPAKSHYYDNNEEGDKGKEDEYPQKQKYTSNRPRGRRRSQRGSGDYHNYDNGEDYPDRNSRNTSYDNGPNPYASTDISRSGDESEPGRPRPKPKRRTKLTSSSSRDFEEPPKEKELHYADLDLSNQTPREDGGYDDAGGNPGRYNRNRRDRRSRGRDDEEESMPVQYASIRV